MQKIRFASIYLLTLAFVFFGVGVFIELHFYYNNETLMLFSEQSQNYSKFLHLIFFLLGFLIITTIYFIEKRESALLEGVNQALQKEIDNRKKVEKERKRLIARLQKALKEVNVLSGLLPICASCKKIRDDKGYWNQIEVYIRRHSEADFSHSICPDCAKQLYPELNLSMRIEKKKNKRMEKEDTRTISSLHVS